MRTEGTVIELQKPTPGRSEPAKRSLTIDEEALAANAAGDWRRALSLLCGAYQTRIYSHCLRMLRDESLADDVAQQCFEQAIDGLRTYRGDSSLCAWLLGIASHRCLDAIKSKRRHLSHVAPDDGFAEAPASSPIADEVLDARLVREALEGCVGVLAEHTRLAVLLHYHEGLSFEAMAPVLGEKPGTLQARVARAMPVLRACLIGKGVTP